MSVIERTYQKVHVYELNTSGIQVMRRTNDNYVNATHVLKVAGLEKPDRTRILEMEVKTGSCHKVQGGYGKFQGTWMPFERALNLAYKHGALPRLQSLFEYKANHIFPLALERVKSASEDSSDSTPSQRSSATPELSSASSILAVSPPNSDESEFQLPTSVIPVAAEHLDLPKCKNVRFIDPNSLLPRTDGSSTPTLRRSERPRRIKKFEEDEIDDDFTFETPQQNKYDSDFPPLLPASVKTPTTKHKPPTTRKPPKTNTANKATARPSTPSRAVIRKQTRQQQQEQKQPMTPEKKKQKQMYSRITLEDIKLNGCFMVEQAIDNQNVQMIDHIYKRFGNEEIFIGAFEESPLHYAASISTSTSPAFIRYLISKDAEKLTQLNITGLTPVGVLCTQVVSKDKQEQEKAIEIFKLLAPGIDYNETNLLHGIFDSLARIIYDVKYGNDDEEPTYANDNYIQNLRNQKKVELVKKIDSTKFWFQVIQEHYYDGVIPSEVLNESLDGYGTLLHRAVGWENSQLVNFLVREMKVNVDAQDDKGQIACEIAPTAGAYTHLMGAVNRRNKELKKSEMKAQKVQAIRSPQVLPNVAETRTKRKISEIYEPEQQNPAGSSSIILKETPRIKITVSSQTNLSSGEQSQKKLRTETSTSPSTVPTAIKPYKSKSMNKTKYYEATAAFYYRMMYDKSLEAEKNEKIRHREQPEQAIERENDIVMDDYPVDAPFLTLNSNIEIDAVHTLMSLKEVQIN
ncbi:hypothetical protein HK098_007184 [Nowakowskiella sp. JEL0407]|nr:hypothetical protein HK098_007184 [Nowakowskiella sp. JEL0407]